MCFLWSPNGYQFDLFYFAGYSSGENPSTYETPASGSVKQTSSYSDRNSNFDHPERDNLRNYHSASLPNLSKRRRGRSNDNSHETTPLFGLWQGYNSHKLSLSDENQQYYNKSNILFLPGQNRTIIRAHIGTTVIMDCKIVTSNLEKYDPVSLKNKT